MSPTDVAAGRRPLAIQRFLDGAGRDRRAVDDFLARHDVPIVEGSSCTFLYRGEAEEVYLRQFIYGLPSRQPLRRIDRSDLWYVVVEIPPGSRCEYKLEVLRGGESRWIEDPLNPVRARDPFGANSVCRGEGYVVPEWTQPDPDARNGTLEEIRIRSRALRRDCPVTLYLPARYRKSRRYALLVAHDGGDLLEYAALRTVLDNLIHRLEIPAVVVALLHPGERLLEYGDSDAHGRFLTTELVPRLEKRFALAGTPRSRCIMGASFGAAASFSAAWRNPGFFGNVFLLSGSFAFTDIGFQERGGAYRRVTEMMNAYRAAPVPFARNVFVTCGVYESLIYENRSLVPLLQETGMNVRYVEARDGHNWENWRDRMREGLSWLMPGPLWMIYE